jgi:hypothetical protein
MVTKYESEIHQLRQELEQAYQTISKEEKKRLQLEDELRKMLLKNMTSLNVEALNIFQHINQSKNAQDILPANISRLSEHSLLLDESQLSASNNNEFLRASPSPKESVLHVTPSSMTTANYPGVFQSNYNQQHHHQHQNGHSSSNTAHMDHNYNQQHQNQQQQQEKWNQFMRFQQDHHQQPPPQQQHPTNNTDAQNSNNQAYFGRLSEMYKQSVSGKLAKNAVATAPIPPPVPQKPSAHPHHSMSGASSETKRVNIAPQRNQNTPNRVVAGGSVVKHLEPQPSAHHPTSAQKNAVKPTSGFGQASDRFKR